MARRPQYLEPPRKVLSPGQVEAITALLAGYSISEVARRAGVSRQAVSAWKRDPTFAAELARRSEVRSDAADRALAGAVERETKAYRGAREATWKAIHAAAIVVAKRVAREVSDLQADPEAKVSTRPGDLEAMIRAAALLRDMEPAMVGDEDSYVPVVRASDDKTRAQLHDLLVSIAEKSRESVIDAEVIREESAQREQP